MRVKLNRGPMKNKYIMVDNDWQDLIRVSKPRSPIWAYDQDEMIDDTPIIYGEYRRSNTTLKNGAVVFEWMGWRE